MKENINIVKIGSDSINKNNLEKIISDAKNWEEKTGEKFIFISSGSVKLWKDRIIQNGWNIEEYGKSSLASIGQHLLMRMFDKISWDEKIVGEILLDDYVNKEYVEKIWIENGGILWNIKHTLRPCCLNYKF